MGYPLSFIIEIRDIGDIQHEVEQLEQNHRSNGTNQKRKTNPCRDAAREALNIIIRQSPQA